ncbi:caspase domain-containing protein [Paraburkholderia sabiae]|uniref:Caspase family protein n=1 Tax=Paraburkholderia sabiae TaxID=273251 RepID=A0ABU9QSF7_9BURK|nr:caspase family protein [Paraburkholderia sabiae]WJZ79846.1 caspase family protein [Paraburkholderia sabiae]
MQPLVNAREDISRHEVLHADAIPLQMLDPEKEKRSFPLEVCMANRALVVGISNYPSPNQLPSCDRDAEEFAKMLENGYGFTEIQVLKDDGATKKNLIDNINALVSSVSLGDRLVLFFSGHGYRLAVDNTHREVLVSHDGEFFFDYELAELTRDVPAGMLTIVLDSCFSGGMLKSWVDLEGNMQTLRTKCWHPHDTAIVPASVAHIPFGNITPPPIQVTEDTVTNGLWGNAEVGNFEKVTLESSDSKALLISACLSDQQAVSSLPSTNGLSAFTFSLLDSVRLLGTDCTSAQLIEATGEKLRQAGIEQTPIVKEPVAPPNLADRGFLTFKAASTVL